MLHHFVLNQVAFPQVNKQLISNPILMGCRENVIFLNLSCEFGIKQIQEGTIVEEVLLSCLTNRHSVGSFQCRNKICHYVDVLAVVILLQQKIKLIFLKYFNSPSIIISRSIVLFCSSDNSCRR